MVLADWPNSKLFTRLNSVAKKLPGNKTPKPINI